MLLLVFALLACVPAGPASGTTRHAGLSEVLDVEVMPGVNGARATWRASLRTLRTVEDLAAHDPLPADNCIAAPDAAPDTTPGARQRRHGRWTSVASTGALTATWVSSGDGWSAHGTLRDPAWAVADLVRKGDAGDSAVETGAIRLGPVPAISRAVRVPDGGARVTWDSRTVDVVRVRARGPSGSMVCGARADGATLPWWAAPPRGGRLQVESTRQRVVRLDDGTLRLVRTVMVQDVQLDAPIHPDRDDARIAVPVRRPSVLRRPPARPRPVAGTG
ncbi:MAG: hypothetical protein RLZZ299_1625 [Pseudomonadota bacterium]